MCTDSSLDSGTSDTTVKTKRLHWSLVLSAGDPYFPMHPHLRPLTLFLVTDSFVLFPDTGSLYAALDVLELTM